MSQKWAKAKFVLVPTVGRYLRKAAPKKQVKRRTDEEKGVKWAHHRPQDRQLQYSYELLTQNTKVYQFFTLMPYPSHKYH